MSTTITEVPRRKREVIDKACIRFCGDSGDGMQITGSQFTNTAALYGNDLATFPDFPAEIRAPAGTLAGVSAFQINFASSDVLTPGDAPNFFPPKAAQPGSVGDADYSPLVEFANAKNALFNMPMVAFNVSEDDLNKMCDGIVDYTKVEDKVLKICPRDGTVTLKLTLGYTFGKPIFYLSTEANDPVVATLEGATYTPAVTTMLSTPP